MELISSHKSKPAKGLTHSLGPKKISELLSGIEIYNNLNLWLSKEKGAGIGLFVPGWNLKYLKGNSTKFLKFNTILTGNYSRSLNKWSIILYSIKIEHNKRVKQFLIETGVPVLRNWFESEKTETWYEGRRYLQIGLNENLTEYCIFETQNDQVINRKTAIIEMTN